MFHFKFHVSLFKTLMERVIAPTVFLNRSLSVFESLPQCFCFSPTVFLYFSHSVFENETMKAKMKHQSSMFQPLKVLIINELRHKNET